MKVGRFGELSYGIEQIGEVGGMQASTSKGSKLPTSNSCNLRELVLREKERIDTQLQSTRSYQLGKKNPFPLSLLGLVWK